MNPPCARCNKTVYPTEKFNCLDKIWHKGCFNCETCRMKLTMKTYKGYNKLPYCNTHYPKTSFTAVADTPENKRLAKNTSNQSSVVYHKDHERERGKFTAVADDPETRRNLKNQNQASSVVYTKEFAKEKGKYTPVTDDPESMRVSKSQQQASDIQYQQRKADTAPTYPVPNQSSRAYEPEPEPEPVAAPPPTASGADDQYVAVYDYTAADDDEVSFAEGDIIINGEIIDDGWMTGTVQRTGETGMLPSNYVEKA